MRYPSLKPEFSAKATGMKPYFNNKDYSEVSSYEIFFLGVTFWFRFGERTNK